MIKDIEEIRELGYKNAVAFLEDCQVFEKLDMFYFKMKVVSKSSVLFFKANNKEIKAEDIILASMWKEPIDLLSKVFLSNQEILKKFIGYTFGFFYLPCEKPLRVSYETLYNKNKVKYIISDIFDSQGKKIEYEEDSSIKNSLVFAFKDIPQVWTFGIRLFDPNEKLTFDKKALWQVFNKKAKNISIKEILWETLANRYSQSLKEQIFLADSMPEGIIFKNGYRLYQMILNQEYKQEKLPNSKIGMEVILTLFAKWSLTNDYNDLITTNYVDTVCGLYEAFMSNADFSLYNISAEELEAPTFGYYSGICYDLIPSKRTKELCHQSKFNENVFKILLNGLRRQKVKDSYQYLTDEYKEVWNQLVKTIQISTMANYSLPLK